MWQFCGYNEIQDPPRRYRIIDLESTVRLMGCTDLLDLQSAHKRWIEASLRLGEPETEGHWTESIAAGSKSIIEEVKKSLGFKAKGRSITGSKDHCQLRENVSTFGNTSLHGPEPATWSDAGTTYTFLWRKIS